MNYEKDNEDKYKEDLWTINRSKYKWFSNYVKLKIFKRWESKVENKDTFLDMGGGVGNWAFHFIDSYKQVIVCDISNEALKRIPEENIIKKQGSVTKIPLQPGSVDCILLADVFEHIKVQDLDKMMLELKRVLKKEGSIIIYTTQYSPTPQLLLDKLLGRMDGRLNINEIYSSGHINNLTFRETKNLIKRCGLHLEDYYHYGILFKHPVDFIKDFLARVIGKLKKDKSLRDGQEIKDKLKNIKNPSMMFKLIFGTLSFISYLDILLFGKIIRGGSIFLRIKK